MLIKINVNTDPIWERETEKTIWSTNLHSLEAVSRYRDPQLQVSENYPYVLNLIANICNFWFLSTHYKLYSNHYDLFS